MNLAALTLPDLVTLLGYALGLWWCADGPTWAGVVSILADEVDGRLARATGTATEHGSALDWGCDIALTPAALARLGRETGHTTAALLAAAPLIYMQARARAAGERPSLGSVRALVMLAAMAAHASSSAASDRAAAVVPARSPDPTPGPMAKWYGGPGCLAGIPTRPNLSPGHAARASGAFSPASSSTSSTAHTGTSGTSVNR